MASVCVEGLTLHLTKIHDLLRTGSFVFRVGLTRQVIVNMVVSVAAVAEESLGRA